jgi:hypothetical protein
MLEVDEAVLAHLEPDRVALALQRVVDLLAPQQLANDLDVFTERRQSHGPAAEQAQAGVAGAETDETPAGARRLIVAMPFAAAGASRSAGTLTPVPSRIRRVACAASASTAQQFDRMIGLSVTQQCV